VTWSLGDLVPGVSVVTWSLGDLAPGVSGTRTLVVQVDWPLSNGTLLINSATLTDIQDDTATDSQTTLVQSAPLLSLSVTDSPDPVEAGGQITYNIDFGNSSTTNETALGITLINTLPSNTTFVIASEGGTVDSSGTRVDWSLEDLAPGATYTLSGTTTFVSASDGGVADSSGALVTWFLGDLPPGTSGTRSLVLQLDSSLSDGTLFTVNATLQDTEGNSATLSITTPIGGNDTVGGTAEVTSPPSTIGGSTIVFLTTYQSSDPTASQDPSAELIRQNYPGKETNHMRQRQPKKRQRKGIVQRETFLLRVAVIILTTIGFAKLFLSELKSLWNLWLTLLF